MRAGDWIEVRSKQEILATLDDKGQLGGMPFMPQMFQYCGQRFKVYKRGHKTCDTIVFNWDSPGRRVADGIHLNLRCDGAAYGGCQAACLIFWNEAWLKPAGDEGSPAGADESMAPKRPNGSTADVSDVDPDFLKTTRGDDVNRRGDPRYLCQATQLLNFSTPLPWWDARQYVEDFTSGNATIGRIFRGFLWTGYYFGTLAFSQRYGRPARWLYDRFQSLWGGLPYPRHRGTIAAGSATPTATLGLQAGDLVRIKTYQEILATLDTKNKNAGMSFDGELMPYCGGTYRVRGRVERFLDEKTGYMKKMKTPAVILEGVFCRARYSDHRLFCPRSIFSWWREIWLERIDDTAQHKSSQEMAAASGMCAGRNGARSADMVSGPR